MLCLRRQGGTLGASPARPYARSCSPTVLSLPSLDGSEEMEMPPVQAAYNHVVMARAIDFAKIELEQVTYTS